MEQQRRPTQGFRRLWQRALFRQQDFQQPDRLNEYDEDYSRLETEDSTIVSATETKE